MVTFGEIIKKARKEKRLSLAEVSVDLKLDVAILSKLERGLRFPTRKQLKVLAKYYKLNEKRLLIACLSDKIAFQLEEEEEVFEILDLAEEKWAYRGQKKEPLLKRWSIQLKYLLEKEEKIEKAWIFGSFARGDFGKNSDIDLMIRLKEGKSMPKVAMDALTIKMEEMLGKKVDLVEEDSLNLTALESATQDRKLIYG